MDLIYKNNKIKSKLVCFVLKIVTLLLKYVFANNKRYIFIDFGFIFFIYVLSLIIIEY